MSNEFTPPASQVALLVIDMQRYFTQRDYPFRQAADSIVKGGMDYYFDRVSEIVIPNIQILLGVFRKSGSPIIFTEFGSHLLDGSDLPSWARRLNEQSCAALGKPMYPPFEDSSARTDDRLKPRQGEPVLRKTTTGTVASSPIDHNLRARGIQSVVVAGVVTDYCVSQTARELADRDFDVAIVEDACASLNELSHSAALSTFSVGYGWVLSTEEVISALR
jgi:nicotinamidase-related amidase